MTISNAPLDRSALLPVLALASFLMPAGAILLLAGAIPITVLTPEYESGVTALAYGEALTAVLAVVVAVITAQTGGGHHRTWPLALGGMLVATATLSFFGSAGYWGAVSTDFYLLLRIVIAVCAGIALGAAFARAWSHESAVPAVAAVSGTAGALIFTEAIARPAIGFPGAYLLGSTDGATAATWTILACGISTAIAAMILDSEPPRGLVTARSPRTLTGLAVIASVLGVLHIGGTDVIARLGVFWPMLGRFAAAAAVIAVLFTLTWVAAMWLGHNDSPWAGAMVLVATAFAAAALPVVQDVPMVDVWWLLIAPGVSMIAAVAIGVSVRHRGYHAVNGLLILAAVPVVGLIAGGTSIGVLIQLIMLAAGGGFAFGVCLPGAGPGATVLALGTVMMGHSYKALLGAAPSSGAVPARPVIGSSTDVPHSWWTLIPDGAGEVLAVALIGLCGVGVLTVSYSAYRLINRRP